MLIFLVVPAIGQQSTLEVDPNLFVVMAAINAVGYDADLASNANSPVRVQVRQWVAQTKPAVLEQLKSFYEAHRKTDPARNLSQFISFALCIEKYDAADGPFNELLALGFLESMKKEWAWRISRGESTRNLDAFRHLLE